MTDLISRADAIEAVEHIMRRDKLYLPLNYKERRKALVNAITMIKKCPSADAEEVVLNKMLEEGMIALPQDYDKVVRCKECIHYESDGGAMMICNVTDTVCDNDDYCSYGERREDGEE